jgi:hypothetical protein
VRKAKNISPFGGADEKYLRRHNGTIRAPQALFLGVFRLLPPFIVLKTTRHWGKSPDASRHSAPAHEISGSRTSQLHAKKTKAIFQRT